MIIGTISCKQSAVKSVKGEFCYSRNGERQCEEKPGYTEKSSYKLVAKSFCRRRIIAHDQSEGNQSAKNEYDLDAWEERVELEVE
jgi:hypothetical protein